MSKPRSVQAQAAGLMLASTLIFGVMAICILLASDTEPTWEVAFYRNFFGLLSLLPILLIPVLRSAKLREALASIVHTKQLPRYFSRCLIGVISMFCGFWAIGHLPMSQAISLAYSSPIFVTIAAVFLLGEKVRMRRWMAVAAGFIGMLIIVRPGSQAFSPGMLIAVAAAVLSAIVAIQIKQLSKVDGPNTIVLWTYLFWVPMSLLPALFTWHWPEGIAWLWLVLCGVFGTGGQWLWTRALKMGEVSALTPISFMQLPVVTFAAWWLFDESVDRWTIIGAAIILSATAYIAHREAQLSKRKASHAPSEAVEPGN